MKARDQLRQEVRAARRAAAAERLEDGDRGVDAELDRPAEELGRAAAPATPRLLRHGQRLQHALRAGRSCPRASAWPCERSSRLPRIVKRIADHLLRSPRGCRRSACTAWAGSRAGGDARARLPRHDRARRRAAATTRAARTPCRAGTAPATGRPAVPAPNRSAGQSSSVVTASSPSIANRSVHSNVIVETTPSSPRLGAHRVEEVGVGVVARELVDVAAPVDQPEAPEVAVGAELQRAAGRAGGGEAADRLVRDAAGVVQRPALLGRELRRAGSPRASPSRSGRSGRRRGGCPPRPRPACAPRP